jgi:hypothetical protein
VLAQLVVQKSVVSDASILGIRASPQSGRDEN